MVAQRVLSSLALVLIVSSAPGCRRKAPPEDMETQPAVTERADTPAVAKCVEGMERAIGAATVGEMLKTYYGACAEVYSKAPCRDAWATAAAGDPQAQRTAMAEACRAAYCPDLASANLEMCKADFAPAAGTLDQAWGPFFNAVLDREGAGAVKSRLVALFLRGVQLGLQSAASAAAGASASAVPAASGSATPVPSGGAAPTASASAAPKPATAPKAR